MIYDSYTGRVDWQANSSNSVFVRYTFSDRFRYVPGIFGGIADGTGSLPMAGYSCKASLPLSVGPKL